MKRETVILVTEGNIGTTRAFSSATTAYNFLVKYCHYNLTLRQLQRNLEAGPIKYTYYMKNNKGYMYQNDEISMYVNKVKVER